MQYDYLLPKEKSSLQNKYNTRKRLPEKLNIKAFYSALSQTAKYKIFDSLEILQFF